MASKTPSSDRWQAPKLRHAFDLQQELDRAMRDAAEYLQQRVADSYVVSLFERADEKAVKATSFFADEPELAYNTRQILGFQARQLERTGLVVDGTV